jgi:hypothetical protein
LYLSKIILVIHRFIVTILGRICSDTKVLDELRSVLGSDLLERYQAGMDQAKFLVGIERDTNPYTLQKSFSTTLEESNTQRIVQSLGGDTVLPAKRSALVNHVKAALKSKSNTEKTVEIIHDTLQAYYDVAKPSFVDNVSRQAVQYCLLSGPMSPLSLFSEKWVLQLDAKKLDSISGESRVTRSKRDQLNKKIHDLESAVEILR